MILYFLFEDGPENIFYNLLACIILIFIFWLVIYSVLSYYYCKSIKNIESINARRLDACKEMTRLHEMFYISSEKNSVNNYILSQEMRYKDYFKFLGRSNDQTYWMTFIKNKKFTTIIYENIEKQQNFIRFRNTALSLINNHIARTYEVSTQVLSDKIYTLYNIEYLTESLLNRARFNKNEEYLSILFNLMRGLQYLKNRKVVFLNLKLDNILGKVSDGNFINYKIVTNNNLFVLKTNETCNYQPKDIDHSYATPEVIYGQSIKQNHDIFALGCIAFYLIKDLKKISEEKNNDVENNVCNNCKSESRMCINPRHVSEKSMICKKCVENECYVKCKFCMPSEDYFNCRNCIGSRETRYYRMVNARTFNYLTLYNKKIELGSHDKDLSDFIEICLKNCQERPDINELIEMDVTKNLFKDHWNYFKKN